MSGSRATQPSPHRDPVSTRNKGKAPCRSQNMSTTGSNSARARAAPRGRGRTLAPKPSVNINPENSLITEAECLQPKRPRVHGPQDSSVISQIPHEMGPSMHCTNNTGFNVPRLIYSHETMENVKECTESQTLVPHLNPSTGVGFPNPFLAETQQSAHFAHTFTFHPPAMIPVNSPVTICAVCDAMLKNLRNDIMAIPDDASVRKVMKSYLAMRDNWHDCLMREIGGLPGSHMHFSATNLT